MNLVSDALIHCLKVSGAGILLVDEDERCRARISAESQRIGNELEMKIVELSSQLKSEIAARKATRIDEAYRKDINGDSPVALFYTRYAPSFEVVGPDISHVTSCSPLNIFLRAFWSIGLLLNFYIVARRDFQKASR